MVLLGHLARALVRSDHSGLIEEQIPKDFEIALDRAVWETVLGPFSYPEGITYLPYFPYSNLELGDHLSEQQGW